jgi:hypothetical protein
MRKIIWYALLALLPTTMLAQAPKQSIQTAKAITISQEEPYTDNIMLTNDVKDKDLMVKFVFNEDKNTLTVSLISYRRLFVFWDDTRYKGTFSGSGKLHIDRLPYVITSNDGDRFRLSKSYRKSLPKPRKQHIFKKWIEYEGLQPVDKERNMVNDYIEQTFDIQNKRTNVVVRLRDILLMDQTGEKGKSKRYELSNGKDLNTEYQITIQRNPCFGTEEEMAAVSKSLTGIMGSYKNFKKKYGKGRVGTEEALKLFKEMKSVLTTQFTKDTIVSQCPDIQKLRDQYNLIVDSINGIDVKMESANILEASGAIMGAKGRVMNTKIILSNARQLDQNVARWLRSNDQVEREDLKMQCMGIIKDTNLIINSGGGQTAEERNAINIFRQAEKYFNKSCK